eukprot:TRINITY_DN210_c0_g2_i2.p1 TRINITY_DN210_c0_g2~~TRINITY_DN210_c0_g2_i2.p1  ORF type:complete len:955 (-),score=392.53 TRINITY_DN210_c0_g2_i2:212-2776(-)
MEKRRNFIDQQRIAEREAFEQEQALKETLAKRRHDLHISESKHQQEFADREVKRQLFSAQVQQVSIAISSAMESAVKQMVHENISSINPNFAVEAKEVVAKSIQPIIPTPMTQHAQSYHYEDKVPPSPPPTAQYNSNFQHPTTSQVSEQQMYQRPITPQFIMGNFPISPSHPSQSMGFQQPPSSPSFPSNTSQNIITREQPMQQQQQQQLQQQQVQNQMQLHIQQQEEQWQQQQQQAPNQMQLHIQQQEEQWQQQQQQAPNQMQLQLQLQQQEQEHHRQQQQKQQQQELELQQLQQQLQQLQAQQQTQAQQLPVQVQQQQQGILPPMTTVTSVITPPSVSMSTTLSQQQQQQQQEQQHAQVNVSAPTTPVAAVLSVGRMKTPLYSNLGEGEEENISLILPEAITPVVVAPPVVHQNADNKPIVQEPSPSPTPAFKPPAYHHPALSPPQLPPSENEKEFNNTPVTTEVETIAPVVAEEPSHPPIIPPSPVKAKEISQPPPTPQIAEDNKSELMIGSAPPIGNNDSYEEQRKAIKTPDPAYLRQDTNTNANPPLNESTTSMEVSMTKHSDDDDVDESEKENDHVHEESLPEEAINEEEPDTASVESEESEKPSFTAARADFLAPPSALFRPSSGPKRNRSTSRSPAPTKNNKLDNKNKRPISASPDKKKNSSSAAFLSSSRNSTNKKNTRPATAAASTKAPVTRKKKSSIISSGMMNSRYGNLSDHEDDDDDFNYGNNRQSDDDDKNDFGVSLDDDDDMIKKPKTAQAGLYSSSRFGGSGGLVIGGAHKSKPKKSMGLLGKILGSSGGGTSSFNDFDEIEEDEDYDNLDWNQSVKNNGGNENEFDDDEFGEDEFDF